MPRGIYLHQPHSIERKLKMSLSHRGERAYNWKGDKVGYSGLHKWVSLRLGKAKVCEVCSNAKSKVVDWANKSHQYKRDLRDWLELCRSCHIRYDKGSLEIERSL